MLTYIPASLRTNWRTATGIALILVAVIALAAACSSDPTPTSPPPPRATPTPTPVPTATPTPTVAPATAMPAPATSEPVAMGPSDDFVVTETTTGGDLIALFSETEAACVRDSLGEEAFATLRDTRVMEIGDTIPVPFECLTPETTTDLQVALFASEIGGLTAESRSCVKEVFAANPGVNASSDLSAQVAFASDLQACLTEEEAMAFMGGASMGGEGGGEPPSPEASQEAMQCMTEKLGNLEEVMAILSGGEPDPETLESVLTAALECGLELAPPGGG